MAKRIYKDSTERNKEFEKLAQMTQKEMKTHVHAKLAQIGYVQSGDGYIYHEGTFPVLLCAHMDTVHKEIPRTLVYANGTLSSTQGIGGDDRCGIYMIFKILKEYDCHVVFLEDEEIGCVGARKFASSKVCKKLKKDGDLKYIIEFDRKGNNHAVTYDCENKEFDEFITKEFFKKEYGTCSDISYIAPELGIAAVNLSCGYYKEHHIEEWVNLAEMETIIIEAMKVLERTKEIEKPFKYIKAVRNLYSRWDAWDDGFGYGYGYSSYGSYGYQKDKDKDKDNNKYDFGLTEYKFMYNEFGIVTSCNIKSSTKIMAYYKFFESHKKVCFADIYSVTIV